MDKFNAAMKLREGEINKEKERKREKKREKERKGERERKWTEWRVGSFTFAFVSVDIQSQLSNYKQTTISEAQKWVKKTFFFVNWP
jgi:hypothetical protein